MYTPPKNEFHLLRVPLLQVVYLHHRNEKIRTRHLSCPVRVFSEASLRDFRYQEVWHWLKDDDGGRRIVLLIAEAKRHTITLRLSMRPN